MQKNNRPCVFPSPTEEEVVTIPGPELHTAYRLSVESGMSGYVRIEQIAYSTDLGWYTQKSFCVPGEVLSQMLPHLRKADCLIPKPAAQQRERLAFHTPSEDRGPIPLVRREA